MSPSVPHYEPESERAIGVRETARQLGVHENTIRNWEARGLLKATRLPGSGFRRFSAEEVARMREEMWSQFAPATELPAARRAHGEVVNGEVIPSPAPVHREEEKDP